MRRSIFTATAAIALMPCAAFAQPTTDEGASPSEDATPNAAPDESIGLGEIIVTAQRKAESSQRAAIAIDVVSGADVVAAGITDARDLSKLVPSLTIQSIGTSNTSFIRGVGNFSVAVTADPAVAFNYDGVYIGRQTSTSGTFFDLDRVEVLKGPQGTLYGRNATAGVINVLPTQPKPGEFSGYATASYGNYNALTAEGAINVPMGDNGAVRVSGTVTDRDGFLSDGTSDSKTQALRFQIKSELTPDLTVRVSADYTHLGGNGSGFTFLNRQVGSALTQMFTITPTGLDRSEGPTSPASTAFFRSLPAGAPPIAGRLRDAFPKPFQDSDFFGINADIVYDAGFATLTVIPAVRWGNFNARSGAGGFPVISDQDDTQYSVEARLAGDIGMFDYTLGGFVYNEENVLTSGSVTFGSSSSFVAPTRQNVTSYAPFARLTANINERLRLVGGVRYTHDSKRLLSRAITVATSCTRPIAIGGCPNLVLPTSVTRFTDLPFPVPTAPGFIDVAATGARYTRSDVTIAARTTDGKVTYRAAIEYDIAPRSLLYASVESGFRSGGFNTLVGFETYEPEYITAFTLGSKNRFFDDRVQLNVEAFYWKYRNQQVSHPSIDLLNRPGSLTENIGKSTIKGIEVDARFKATRTTTLSTSVAYLDAQNKEFVYTVPFTLGTLTGCGVTPLPTPPVPQRIRVDCSGRSSFNAPKWSLNLAAEQVIPLGDFQFVVGADTAYKSRRVMGFEYQPFQIQDSSWTSNAQIAFGPSDNMWSLTAFVRNIENDRLLVAPFVFGGLGIAYTTPPRTYGVRGSVKF